MKEKYISKEFVYTYGNMIYRVALGYLGNNEDSEDIVQDVFVKHMKYLRNGKTFNNQEHERYWLIRVGINLCCNKLKSRKNIESIPYEDEKVTKDELYNKEFCILDYVDMLDDKYKVVFQLYYIKKFKVSEISKILHITESAVKTRLKRGRKNIKEVMENDMQYSKR